MTGARKIGTDSLGNKYFEAKARKDYNHTRRFVIYKGDPDASKVPPEWHGWLHHQNDNPPLGNTSYRRAWQKPFQQNLTGTAKAYLPEGHLLKSGKRPAATGDYEAWTPPQ